MQFYKALYQTHNARKAPATANTHVISTGQKQSRHGYVWSSAIMDIPHAHTQILQDKPKVTMMKNTEI